jgi:hypothetical protein
MMRPLAIVGSLGAAAVVQSEGSLYVDPVEAPLNSDGSCGLSNSQVRVDDQWIARRSNLSASRTRPATHRAN